MAKTGYALILAGGGAKGVYQIGVWKALKELKIKIDAVIGNSVGALNGALFIQNNFDKTLDLWKNMSLDKIIKIPKELIQNGSFHIDAKNIYKLKELREIFFKHKGLDTSPLKNIIKTSVNENKIRKSKIDFGLTAYDLNNLKPLEIFLDEMPEGSLIEYLIASASIPFVFQKTEIKGKYFIDGGIYDNIPFAMAKKRGYKNFIIVDMSGLGVNRRPDMSGTNSIYIKNSIDMGHILDFSQKFLKEFMNTGYLDTLKIFGKVNGINYFYKKDEKILDKLEGLIFNEEIFKKYCNYLKKSRIKTNEQNIKNEIREILPENYKYYKNIITSLSECAAISLNINRNKLYTYKEFLNSIWDKYNLIEDHINSTNTKKSKNFFENLSQQLKNINFSVKNLSKTSSYEYDKIFEIIFGKDRTSSHIKSLANFFPYLLPAKIFFVLLKILYTKAK